MGYSFTDLGAEGCRRSLNALFFILWIEVKSVEGLILIGRVTVPVTRHSHVDGLVQNCSIPSVIAMEILQSGTKPSVYHNIYTVINYRVTKIVSRYISSYVTSYFHSITFYIVHNILK